MENFNGSGSGSGYNFPPSHDFGLDQDFFNWTDYADDAQFGQTFPLTNNLPTAYPSDPSNSAGFQHQDFRIRENANGAPTGLPFQPTGLTGISELTPEVNQRLSFNLEQQFAHMLAMQDNNQINSMHRPETRRQSSVTNVATPALSTASSNPPKRKGRPRLDKDEDTKKSRRRAQLRSAQRGYKARKEQTISDLTGRLNQIEPMIEEMSSHLMKFHDEAVTRGLMERDPVLGKSLVATLEKMLKIAKLVCGESGGNGHDENEDGGDEPEKSNNDSRQTDTQISAIPEEPSSELLIKTPLPEDESHLQEPPEAEDVDMDLGSTESFRHSPTPTPTSNIKTQPDTSKRATDNPIQPQNATSRPEILITSPAPHKSSPTLSITSLAQTFNPLITTRWPNTPKVPRNSFSGHLRYNCLLMAYSLLTTKYPNMQNRVSRIFQLHLHQKTKDQIRIAVQKLLEDTSPGPFVLEEQDWLKTLHMRGLPLDAEGLDGEGDKFREITWDDLEKDMLPYHEIESYLFEHRSLGFVGGWFVLLDGGRYNVSGSEKQTGFSMFKLIKELIPYGFCTGTSIYFPKVDVEKCVDVLLGL